MGRNANPLTATQKDDSLFQEKVSVIKRIGMRNLSRYGLISHETIAIYCRRLPVAQSSEERIDQSIARYQEEQDELGSISVARTRQLLAH